jgi:hypothetical protein
MSRSVRCYLFSVDGLLRISQRVMNGLCRGRDAMPQYAHTRQKIAAAIYELENGKPVRILTVEGSYLIWILTSPGRFRTRGAFEAMQAYDDLENSNNAQQSKVFDITPKLNREKWKRENRWTPNQQELDLIADDIFNRRSAAPLKLAKAKAEKPPPLTYEAKEAIREIGTQLYSIASKLEGLSEQDLKGLNFAARHKRGDGLEQLWQGVANAADRRREILARYRTGRGVWYASIEFFKWEPHRYSGQSDTIAYKKCNSKKEAEGAARLLLAENAKYFTAENSVEARVVCDLEWEKDQN